MRSAVTKLVLAAIAVLWLTVVPAIAQVVCLGPIAGPTSAGCVPPSGGGTTNFLRADGTWSNPNAVTNTPAYYVSATTGSDSNNGLSPNVNGGGVGPYATITQCQTTMRSSTIKTCYVRGGTYALAAGGLVLTTADNGETFSYYSGDGVGSPILTTAAVSASTPAIATSCVGCTVNGFTLNVSGNVAAYIPITINGNGTQLINNVLNGQNATSGFYMVDVGSINAVANANISGNTIENFGGGGSDGDAIYLNSSMTNSVVAHNTIQCINSYGVRDAAGGSNNNLIYGNTAVGGGHVGGAPPGCGPLAGGGGGDYNMGASGGNLIANNNFSGNIGYAIVVNSPTGVNYIENNTLEAPANPTITVNGSPAVGTMIRNNAITSGGDGLNLGTEKDACPEVSSQGLLIAHNTITSGYEPIILTASVNSIIFDNKTNIGIHTVTITGGPHAVTNHYAAGLSMSSKAFDEACGSPVYNTGNIIYNNQFTSANGNGGYDATLASWGVYISANGGGNTGNTISHNILYPFGNPGTLAYQPNGISQTQATDNQTSNVTSVATAPPIANAGPAQIIAGGSTLTLNGNASANFPGGGVAGITYAWSCLTNCSGISITSSTAVSTTVTGIPTKAAMAGAAQTIVFQLVATNANGSSTDQVAIGVDPNL